MIDLNFLFYVLIMLFSAICIAAVVRRNFHVMFYYIIGIISFLLSFVIVIAEVLDYANK
jgi:hypothetical protein